MEENRNCIGPLEPKTLGEKTVGLINDLTLKQVWAVLGKENDLITGEYISPEDRKIAILTLISGEVLKVTSKGVEVTEAGTKALYKNMVMMQQKL